MPDPHDIRSALFFHVDRTGARKPREPYKFITDSGQQREVHTPAEAQAVAVTSFALLHMTEGGEP
jgi:hypothetical protein